MGTLRIAGRIACATLIIGTSALAQVRENVTVEVIEVPVYVFGPDGQPIRGLQASDFTVLEDGKPRPIRVFEAVDLPARRPLLDSDAEADAGSQVVTIRR